MDQSNVRYFVRVIISLLLTACVVRAEAGVAPSRQAFVAVAVGIFSGECFKASDQSPVQGAITVLKTGAVTAPGAKTNLLSDQVTMTFLRNLDLAGTATDAQFTAATSNSPAMTLLLSSGASLEDNGASLVIRTDDPGPKMKLEGIQCGQTPQATALKAANVTSFAMPFILSPLRKLKCTNGTISSYADYEVTGLQVKFAGNIIGIARGIKSEAAILSADAKAFTYSTELHDGREFGALVDLKGKLMQVTVRLKAGGDPLICTPK